MIALKNYRKYGIVFLYGIILFHLINFTFCFFKDFVVCGKDAEHHLSNTASIMAALDSPEKGWIKSIFYSVSDYPPLYYIMAIILSKILGWISPLIILFTSSIFFIILLLSLYRSSEVLQENSGWLTVFIVSFYPAVYSGIYQFNLELSSCAMTALCFSSLLQAYLFKSKKHLLMTGIFLGLAMLLRQFLLLFWVGPIIYAGWDLLKGNNRILKKYILLSAALTCIICAPFYLWGSAFAHTCWASVILVDDKFKFFSLSFSLFLSLVQEGTGEFLAWIFFMAIIFLIASKLLGKKIVFLTIILPFILMFLILLLLKKLNTFFAFNAVNQQNELSSIASGHYIFPVLPFIALATGLGLGKIPYRKFKYAVYVFVVTMTLVLFFKETSFSFCKQHYDNKINYKQYGGLYKKFDNPNFASKIFKGFNGQNQIGLLSLGTEQASYSLFDRLRALMLLDGNYNTEVVDFFSNPGQFLKNLEGFKYLIISSDRKHNEWLSENLINQEIKTFFETRKILNPFKLNNSGKYYLIDYAMNPFKNAKLKFKLKNMLKYYVLPEGKPLFLDVYKNDTI